MSNFLKTNGNKTLGQRLLKWVTIGGMAVVATITWLANASQASADEGELTPGGTPDAPISQSHETPPPVSTPAPSAPVEVSTPASAPVSVSDLAPSEASVAAVIDTNTSPVALPAPAADPIPTVVETGSTTDAGTPDVTDAATTETTSTTTTTNTETDHAAGTADDDTTGTTSDTSESNSAVPDAVTGGAPSPGSTSQSRDSGGSGGGGNGGGAGGNNNNGSGGSGGSNGDNGGGAGASGSDGEPSLGASDLPDRTTVSGDFEGLTNITGTGSASSAEHLDLDAEVKTDVSNDDGTHTLTMLDPRYPLDSGKYMVIDTKGDTVLGATTVTTEPKIKTPGPEPPETPQTPQTPHRPPITEKISRPSSSVYISAGGTTDAHNASSQKGAWLGFSVLLTSMGLGALDRALARKRRPVTSPTSKALDEIMGW